MKPTRLFLLLLAFLVATLCSAAAPQKSTPKAAPKAAPKTAGPSHVALDTSMGKIVIELYPDKAPKTVANFIKYVKSGQYDGTIFHRVIPNFMAQAGGFTAGMVEKPTKTPIQNESDNGLGNERATVAMARTSDPNSAKAQFFINVKDNAGLNFKSKPDGWGYAVFGKVVEGMDVVDKIVAVPTTSKGHYEDVPKEPILIKKARVVTP